MTKTSKILLAISITALALSFSDAGSDIGWGILRPLGAVAFGAFFITNLLAKEVALFDAEERAKRKDGECQPRTSLQHPQPSHPSRLDPAMIRQV